MDKHILHVYENPFLTMFELKKMLSDLCYGRILFTEKFDGQNLLLSYSTRDSSVRIARSNTHLKAAGLDPEGFKALYTSKPHDYQRIVDSFVDAALEFEKFAKSLPIREQIELFGQDNVGNPTIFWNFEVINPSVINLLPYDGSKYLIMHKTGHKQVTDDNKLVKFFVNERYHQKMLKKVNIFIKNAENTPIKVNEMLDFSVNNTKSALDMFLNRLKVLQNKLKLAEKSTILEYLIAILTPKIEEEFQISPEKHKLIIKRIIADANHGQYITKPKLSEIVLNVSLEDKNDIKKFLRSEKPREYFNDAIRPIELLIHEFSVSLLQTLESQVATNGTEFNSDLQQRMKEFVKEPPADLPNSYNRHIKKIGNLKDINIKLEGIVFEFDGHVYKLTGNFAPINQLLGYQKYRKTFSAPTKEELDFEVKNLQGKLAIIPGGFKPPHKGHVAMIKHYLTKGGAEKVLVFMGKKPRPVKNPDTHETVDHIDFMKAKKLWDIYLSNENLSHRVKIVESSDKGPLYDAYKYIETESQSGDYIILGLSEKDPERFKDVKKVKPKGVTIETDNFSPIKTFADSNVGISGIDFREAIAVQDRKEILNFIPISSHKDMNKIFKVLFTKSKLELKKKQNQENLLESILVKIMKDLSLDEMSSMSGGGVEGGVGGAWDKPKKSIKLDGYEKIIENMIQDLL